MILPRIFRDPPVPAWREEIRAMKARIERERAAEPERPWHLKLGPGGLSDLEFTVQFLQLRHGHEDPALRVPSTAAALPALAGRGHLAPGEADLLLAGYRFLTRLRQALYLLRPEVRTDVLPVHEARLGAALARALGLPDFPALRQAYQDHTGPVREVFLRYLG